MTRFRLLSIIPILKSWMSLLRQGILSEREMVARQEILLENYARTLMIEGHVMADMVRSLVLPPAKGRGTKRLLFSSP